MSDGTLSVVSPYQRELLGAIFQVFIRPIPKNGKITKYNKYSILWSDVIYEVEDSYVNNLGEHVKQIEYLCKDCRKHSIEYYKNDELVSRIIWWRDGTLKNISSCVNGVYAESAYTVNGQLEYIISLKL
jgi:hypothetical protein